MKIGSITAGFARKLALLLGLSAMLGLAACSSPKPESSSNIGVNTAGPYAPQRYAYRSVPAEERVQGDYVVVDKSDRTLTVFQRGNVLRTFYGLQFGDVPMGHKQFQGDERTPEGRYTIDLRNPQSSYYLSLRISYPNANDRAFARQWGRSPGGDIYIHGQPNGMNYGRMRGDWTDGCIALTNEEITELWRLIPDGTTIVIQR